MNRKKFKPVVYATAEEAEMPGDWVAEPYNNKFISVMLTESKTFVWCRVMGDASSWVPRDKVDLPTYPEVDRRTGVADRRVKPTETTPAEWEQNSDRYRP